MKKEVGTDLKVKFIFGSFVYEVLVQERSEPSCCFSARESCGDMFCFCIFHLLSWEVWNGIAG